MNIPKKLLGQNRDLLVVIEQVRKRIQDLLRHKLVPQLFEFAWQCECARSIVFGETLCRLQLLQLLHLRVESAAFCHAFLQVAL